MKQGRMRVIVVLVLMAAALGAVYWWYFHTPLGRLVVDITFGGIILDPEKCPADIPFTNTWKVEPGVISEMESKMETSLNRDRTAREYRVRGDKIVTGLRYYRRQYLGVIDRNGDKLIESFFCHKDIMSRRDWLLHHFDIAGKGYDWSITYDTYTNMFRDLTVHAEE